MADKKITIVIKGKDESAKALSNVRKNLKKTSKQVSTLSGKMLSIGKSARNMGKKFTMFATAPIVAFGVKAVASLFKFNKAMGDINTLFDDNGKSIDVMKKGITEILKRSPKNADDLGASAYAIVSAGVAKASDALKVLNNSQKLAVAGLGTTAQSADIITSAMNSFGKKAKDSGKIANTFFLGVKGGKTTVADLAQGFGRVAPIASKLGVSFKDIISSVSAMTTSGMKAEDAYVQVKALLSSMLKPTAQMSDAMKKIGLNSNNLSKTIGKEGLTNVLKSLSGAVGGNRSKLAQMFGNVRGLNGVMMLLGGTGEKAKTIFKEMTTNTDALSIAFGKQSKKASFQYNVMKNQLGIAMRKLANVILPDVIKGIKKLTSFFSGLTSKQIKLIAIVLGIIAILGPLLLIFGMLSSVIGGVISAVTFLAVAFGISSIAVLGIIAGIIALIAVGYLIYKNWGAITTFLSNIWKKTADFLIGIWNKITGFFKSNWKVIKTILLVIAGVLMSFVTIGYLIYKNWAKISAFAVLVWKKIKEVVQKALSGIWDAIKNFINFVVGSLVLLFKLFGINLPAVLLKMKQDFINIWQSIENLVGTIWSGITSAFGKFVGFLKSIWDTAFNAMSSVVFAFVSAVQGIITALFAYISPVITNALGTLKVVWSKVWNGLSKITSDVADKIKSVIDDLKSWVGSAVDWLTNKFNRIINLAKSIGSSISGFTGRVTNIGHSVTGLAVGGRVSPNKPYLVGENGPELFSSSNSGYITPNNKLGGNIIINISGNTLLDRRAGEKIGDQIIKKLKFVTNV